jgi:hypothetical protein
MASLRRVKNSPFGGCIRRPTEMFPGPPCFRSVALQSRRSSYVLGFQDIDKTKNMVVGGNGANLAEISKVEGVRIPDGFCISTEAFKRIIREATSITICRAR